MSKFRPKTDLKKMHRSRKDKTVAKRGTELLGEYGLKILSSVEITEFQLEACRKALQNSLKRQGNVECRIFPDVCKGNKPIQSRMGKGAANPTLFYKKVAPGMIIWEVSGVSEEAANKALSLAAVRLPGLSKIIKSKNSYIT